MDDPQKIIIGWREWLILPELGIKKIKAKIDTGARTSALHAFDVKTFKYHTKLKVHFAIHPLQHNNNYVVECEKEVTDYRSISDSGGHTEKRYVIKTPVIMGGKEYPIEITLTNRDTMFFRMLLGRTALKAIHCIINPAKSYLLGKL